MDIAFHGNESEKPMKAMIKVDVSDVARNVASMGRLLRAGFDMHFTNDGHDCWMQRGDQRVQIKEDSRDSEAPLYSIAAEVLPPPD